MSIFFLLNGWAGRFELLDQAMRVVYIATVPLLATLLLALLVFAPPRVTDPTRRRIVAATALAGLLSILSYLLLELFSTSLGVSTLSPRPFMTRYVNLLVVEPQDNSFPAPELMLAGVLVTSIWAMRLRLGLPALALLLLLGFARIFCGTNYFADVAVGAAVGIGWGALALCALKVPLRLHRPAPVTMRRLNLQGGFAAMALMGLGLITFVVLASDPRFAARLQASFSLPAIAAPITDANRYSGPTRAARGVLQEGEGPGAPRPVLNDAEAHALAKRSHLFLPELEEKLKGILGPQTKPFQLLDVEAAPLIAGPTPYKCVALRFEVGGVVKGDRNQVTRVAAKLVRASFAADRQLQSVDVTAILRGDGSVIDQSKMVFIGGEVPVFTASILRENLSPRLGVATPTNAEMWLSQRSKLYINERVLPQVQSAPTVAPAPAKASGAIGAQNFEVSGPTPTPPTTKVRPVFPAAAALRKPAGQPKPRPVKRAKVAPTPRPTVGTNAQGRGAPAQPPTPAETTPAIKAEDSPNPQLSPPATSPAPQSGPEPLSAPTRATPRPAPPKPPAPHVLKAPSSPATPGTPAPETETNGGGP